MWLLLSFSLHQLCFLIDTLINSLPYYCLFDHGNVRPAMNHSKPLSRHRLFHICVNLEKFQTSCSF